MKKLIFALTTAFILSTPILSHADSGEFCDYNVPFLVRASKTDESKGIQKGHVYKAQGWGIISGVRPTLLGDGGGLEKYSSTTVFLKRLKKTNESYETISSPGIENSISVPIEFLDQDARKLLMDRSKCDNPRYYSEMHG